MYREDYSRAGLRMIPDLAIRREGKRNVSGSFFLRLALLPVSLLTSILGLSGIRSISLERWWWDFC